MERRTFRVLNGFALKRIAIVSMAIDHFGSIIMDGALAPYRVDGAIAFTKDMPLFIRNAPLVKAVCEALGSVAFPIFCFLLVEGFLHTHSRLRYCLRLGLFALLSEIPFDLAHSGRIFSLSLQNVLFTLLIGIGALCAIAWIEERLADRRLPRIFATAGVALTDTNVAFLIRSEYVFLGVFCIVLLYLLRKNRYLQLAALLPLCVASPWIALAAPPIVAYNGQRGRGLQSFFYIFYPAHFLLFAGIAYLLAQRAV